MESDTPLMKFKIEYDDYDIETLNIKTNARGETLAKFTTDGMNFGIIERPRQSISMEKRIQNVKLKYSSGETVVNADIVEKTGPDGNITTTLEGQTDYTSYIGSYRDRRNSLIRIEADSEILQNTSVEAIYEYIIRNESEKDYNNEDFYNFGKIPNSDAGLVTITPLKVMDYLSNEATIKADSEINQTNGWDLKTLDEAKELVDTGVEKGNVKFVDAVKKLYMYLAEKTDKLKELKPKENTTMQMEINKRLSANDEDKENITNQVEIVEIKKSYGRRIAETTDESTGISIKSTIPGNYVPNMSSQEIDDSTAEEIAIISSTGANRDYALKVTISIIILTVIAGGIYYILKKKNKK